MPITTPVGAESRPTSVTLSQPGQILVALERCMAARIAPGRSGWSQTGHLIRDLRRLYAVEVAPATIHRALRELAGRGAIRLHVDAGGKVWYRLDRPG